MIGGIHNFKRFSPLRLQHYVIIDKFPFHILFGDNLEKHYKASKLKFVSYLKFIQVFNWHF